MVSVTDLIAGTVFFSYAKASEDKEDLYDIR